MRPRKLFKFVISLATTLTLRFIGQCHGCEASSFSPGFISAFTLSITACDSKNCSKKLDPYDRKLVLGTDKNSLNFFESEKIGREIRTTYILKIHYVLHSKMSMGRVRLGCKSPRFVPMPYSKTQQTNLMFRRVMTCDFFQNAPIR